MMEHLYDNFSALWIVACHYPSGCRRDHHVSMTRTGRSTALAAVLLAVVVAELLTAIAAGALSGMSAARLNELLVFTNTGLGVTLAVAGWPIATYRPANRVGWLLLGGGVAYASTGAGLPLLACVAQAGWADQPLWRALATVVSGSWSWA